MVPDGCRSTSQTYHLGLPSLESRTRFIDHLRERHVMAVFHYQPVHLAAGRRLDGRLGQRSVSDAGDTLVRLPLYVCPTKAHVIENVTEFVP